LRDLLREFEDRYVRPRAGRTLIVGSQVYGEKEDRRARYADAVGVDMLAGPGVDRVVDLEDPLPPDLGTFAHIECMSVMEHSRRPWLLAANLLAAMEPDATLYLTVPFVWRYHSYPGDFFRFTADGVRSLFPGIEWRRLMYASDKLREDHFLKVDEKGETHPKLPRCEVVGFGVRA
jgi:hypothetical protein